MYPRVAALLLLLKFSVSCQDDEEPVTPPPPENFSVRSRFVNGQAAASKMMDIVTSPTIEIIFTAALDRTSAREQIRILDGQLQPVPSNMFFTFSDSAIILKPQQTLAHYSKYLVDVTAQLVSAKNTAIKNPGTFTIYTSLDSTDKFPRITDEQLLDKVQQTTFKYFDEGAHPASGMARERNSSGDIVTTGGTGMGIMATLAAVERGFVSRQKGLDMVTKITDFLMTKCTRYHGAFAHWVNGATGATIPFSPNDNGADLVETSLLIQGLLAARQNFDHANVQETSLRAKINTLWEGVEWDWFRRNNENVLYWHWSPDKEWAMNMKIQGWNECLITYILAASSPTHPIPAEVYDEGYARSGAMRNGKSFYGYVLPLGPDRGGPLFWAHYSFLGLDPNGLSDKWADYGLQVKNHSLINHAYCLANPLKYYGYSDSCWGLTASDNSAGYSAHEPNNDLGVISPTAALSSMPYSPAESMKALHFFYYLLGDKIWKNYGFVDSFEMGNPWFADSFLAIDQGPIIVMIENHRSGLLWNLMKTCPELKAGLKKLGFTAPWL
jgi:hypothetical protein